MNKKNYWLPAVLMVIGVAGIIAALSRDGESWEVGLHVIGWGSFAAGILLLSAGQPKKKNP